VWALASTFSRSRNDVVVQHGELSSWPAGGRLETYTSVLCKKCHTLVVLLINDIVRSEFCSEENSKA
jgi:hypothetical protein